MWLFRCRQREPASTRAAHHRPSGETQRGADQQVLGREELGFEFRNCGTTASW